MKRLFKGVRRHIGKLDAERLREQYGLVSDELAFSEAVFHTMKEGFMVLNANGTVTWQNPACARLLGMKPEDSLPFLAVPLGKAARREIAVTYPEVRMLEMQTVPMGAETLVRLSDVTAERRRTEEELRAGASQAVRELANGVAHEIGNPLNAISLNLQLLERTYPDEPLLAECRGQINRLDGILRGFLQALRPSKPNLAPGSLADPLRPCLSALRAQLEERRIAVTLDAPAALPSVALDAGQIEQVFFNLLKNALEALHDGGAIAIAVDSDDNDVTVAIRDNGEGMDSEQLVHLFEPYRTTKAHGNGLGLMISQRIVRDHGGTIDVESVPGRGTTFTVRVPRLEKRIRRLNG